MNEHQHDRPDLPAQLPTRQIPRNLEAERALVGAVMLDGNVLDRVSAVVRSEDFWDATLAEVFRLCQRMRDENQEIDPISVAEAWGKDGRDLAEISRGADLTALANECWSTSPARQWAEAIAEKARLRGLIEIGGEIADLAFDGETSTEALERAEALILNERQNAPTAVSIFQVGTEALTPDQDRAFDAMRPWKREVAEISGPVCSTDLVVLAGRPATGKTAKALELLLRLAIEGIPVLFLSLEMSREQVFFRLVALITGTHIPRDPRERDDFHAEQITKATVQLRRVPLYIDDGADLSPRSLRWKVRRYRKQHGIRFVALDYLQLLQPDDRRETQFDTVTNASKACKATAKENRIGFLALSQMNRDIERQNRKPKVSDLRQSGQIEQDADLIVFLHAPGSPEARGDEWIVQTLIPKNRHGRTGEIDEVFNPARMKFTIATPSDLARLTPSNGGGRSGPYG